MEKLTMTLSDGTKLKNLTKNGSNFVSSTKITEEDFAGKLRTVTVSGGESEEVMENCELVQITKVDKEYWFVLSQLTSEELERKQMKANIDYIAAMTDVEL
ncbi:MAG: hypothetical protein IJI23_00145 [Lachnospiraceae bacterium]|nr:hypothetical protein [Lachnospiraceae bacterium]